MTIREAKKVGGGHAARRAFGAAGGVCVFGVRIWIIGSVSWDAPRQCSALIDEARSRIRTRACVARRYLNGSHARHQLDSAGPRSRYALKLVVGN